MEIETGYPGDDVINSLVSGESSTRALRLLYTQGRESWEALGVNRGATINELL